MAELKRGKPPVDGRRSPADGIWQPFDDMAGRLAAKLAPADNGCIEWTGRRDQDGYGMVNIYRAHRVAWQLAHPDEDWPTLVRHTCDNPPCCNPDHLLVGTFTDNSQDMVARGRSPRGALKSNAKLTTDQVREIRAAYRPKTYGSGVRALATRYGVSRWLITRVLAGKSWTWVEPS